MSNNLQKMLYMNVLVFFYFQCFLSCQSWNSLKDKINLHVEGVSCSGKHIALQ